MDGGDKASPFDFRRAKFKAVIDADAAKKKRETVINQVRRQKKEDRWAKFRSGTGGAHVSDEAGAAPVGANITSTPAAAMDALQPTRGLDPHVAARVRSWGVGVLRGRRFHTRDEASIPATLVSRRFRHVFPTHLAICRFHCTAVVNLVELRWVNGPTAGCVALHSVVNAAARWV